MTTTTRYTLKKNFDVDPARLTLGLDEYLFERLKELVVGTCDKEKGYIDSVVELLRYENYISNATSQVIYSVIYIAECIKPTKGDKVMAKVVAVTNDGIFCLVYNNRCPALVPMTKLHERYSRQLVDGARIINPQKKDDAISIGMDIHVEIVNVRFENKQFACIAIII